MSIKFTKSEDFSKLANEELMSLVLGEDVGIKLKLEKLLKDRNINSVDLAKITGIRHATLRNYVRNDKSTTLNLQHAIAIIIALRITDISEFIEIDMDSETKKRFKADLKLWKENNWQPIYRKGQQDS